jgi:hypothetical protein
VTDAINDLRATADDLVADADRLREIEERKGDLPADDPAMLELSAEAERLSKGIAAKATAEHELAREVSEASEEAAS